MVVDSVTVVDFVGSLTVVGSTTIVGGEGPATDKYIISQALYYSGCFLMTLQYSSSAVGFIVFTSFHLVREGQTLSYIDAALLAL